MYHQPPGGGGALIAVLRLIHSIAQLVREGGMEGARGGGKEEGGLEGGGEEERGREQQEEGRKR